MKSTRIAILIVFACAVCGVALSPSINRFFAPSKPVTDSSAVAGLAAKGDIADCDTALKLMPLNLEARETRGFIFLKLGEPAKALKEYAAALEIDPNRPLALYGRGLAQCRLGKEQDGEKNKAAATAIAPDIERQFTRFGVS
jgi:tetratricopeptide (TPR) repeat protein